MSKEIKRRSFAPGALSAPLPPALVTVGTLERANVLTVAWTGILATVPPRTYISVRPSRHSYGMLKESGEFVINLASADMAREVDYAGIYTGAKVDKFKKCGFTKQESEKVAPPTVAECPVALECRVAEVIPMGSHDVFIADILAVSCREEIIDEAGKMHFERANLLAYAHGEYYALGERLGRFGFSADKAQKAMVGQGKAKAEREREKQKGSESAASAPFYVSLPKGKRPPPKKKNPDKGKPHGRRMKEKNEK